MIGLLLIRCCPLFAPHRPRQPSRKQAQQAMQHPCRSLAPRFVVFQAAFSGIAAQWAPLPNTILISNPEPYSKQTATAQEGCCCRSCIEFAGSRTTQVCVSSRASDWLKSKFAHICYFPRGCHDLPCVGPQTNASMPAAFDVCFDVAPHCLSFNQSAVSMLVASGKQLHARCLLLPRAGMFALLE